MEAIFGLLVKNLKHYRLQGKCLPNEINSSHKESLQGKTYFAENVVYQNKNFFFFKL